MGHHVARCLRDLRVMLAATLRAMKLIARLPRFGLFGLHLPLG